MTRLGQDADEHDEDSLLGSLVVPIIVVAVVALLGWGLLALAKAVIVTVTYAVGIAMVVVPVVLFARLVRGRTGRARWRRVGSLLATVLLGVVLIGVAQQMSRHGWLLIAIPATVVAVWWLVDRIAERISERRRRRSSSGSPIG